jgi:protein LTV1
LNLDPDIVAAMDEDFDFEDPDNELEDNFIELANAEVSGGEMGADVKSVADDCSDE